MIRSKKMLKKRNSRYPPPYNDIPGCGINSHSFIPQWKTGLFCFFTEHSLKLNLVSCSLWAASSFSLCTLGLHISITRSLRCPEQQLSSGRCLGSSCHRNLLCRLEHCVEACPSSGASLWLVETLLELEGAHPEYTPFPSSRGEPPGYHGVLPATASTGGRGLVAKAAFLSTVWRSGCVCCAGMWFSTPWSGKQTRNPTGFVNPEVYKEITVWQ